MYARVRARSDTNVILKKKKKAIKFRGTFGAAHTSLNDMRKEMRKGQKKNLATHVWHQSVR